MALLEVSDLSVRFQTDDGPVQAVDSVSLTLEHRAGRLELCALDHLRALRKLHVALHGRLALALVQALPAVLVFVDQSQKLHLSPF